MKRNLFRQVGLLMVALAAMLLPVHLMASQSFGLPTYPGSAQSAIPNPFIQSASGALPPCPHVCLFVSDGESAEDAIRQFEQQNHCTVQAGNTDAPSDQDMQLSQQGRDLLKSIETLRLKPYDDQTGKDVTEWVEGATIGYGHLISKMEWDLYKDGITVEQADELFENDLSPFVDVVNEAITVSVSQQQFDAMVLLAYNIGPGSFSGSSVVKLVNDPSAKTPYASLEDAWKAWNKSQGKINQGLINRRAAEWKIYTDGVYERW